VAALVVSDRLRDLCRRGRAERLRKQRLAALQRIRQTRKECLLVEELRLCQTEEQRKYVRIKFQHSNAFGEWYAGRERRARCLPPADTSRGGRPNKSGHMSLMKLDKLERELVNLGILSAKPTGTTNGRKIGVDATTGEVIRARGIKVVRSAMPLIRRALQRFGFFFGPRFRRRKNESVNLLFTAPARLDNGSHFDQIVSRLEKRRRRWRPPPGIVESWSARCPVPGHIDRHPSFCISLNSAGKVLAHCHSGCCSQDEVFEAVFGRSPLPTRPPRRRGIS
jgi:hypothetical protein